MVYPEPVFGINLVVQGKSTAPEFAGTVRRAFYLVGIDASANDFPTLPPNTLIICVGHKPKEQNNNSQLK
ncbi:MAG TPA: hypothetical protein VI362_00030 [Ignavibacteriaceae bacterium]|nr:hypothetical protein [Ignavibacteriaceae bacterium]